MWKSNPAQKFEAAHSKDARNIIKSKKFWEAVALHCNRM
jgi:hypothetical protein